MLKRYTLIGLYTHFHSSIQNNRINMKHCSHHEKIIIYPKSMTNGMIWANISHTKKTKHKAKLSLAHKQMKCYFQQ